MKPVARLGNVGSCLELLGARLASAVGVPVPDYGLVVVTEDLLARVSPQARERLGAGAAVNFATRFLVGFVDVLTAVEVPEANRPDVCAIFAFDVKCDNPDRADTADRPLRSNLLKGDEKLFAIDHQNLFAWYFLLGRREPVWDVSMLRAARRTHFLRSVAHFEPGVTLNRLRRDFRRLDDTALASICGDMPPEWMSDDAVNCLRSVERFLGNVRDRTDEICDAIEAGD